MAQIDFVDDHGIEVIRKAGYIPDDTYKSRYALRTSVTGSIKPSGLNVGGLITVVTVTDAWTPLPAVPLTGRNALGIQNQSSSEIKINYDNTVVGYVGVKIDSSSERFYDVSDSIVIYARTSSGSADIIVEEIA